jgi:hypothetical protein
MYIQSLAFYIYIRKHGHAFKFSFAISLSQRNLMPTMTAAQSSDSS